ncbi:glucosamine-6-phosphate deaminase [Virgibacillus sp. W0430]|uniref:glucosamine-6-phosphate deaminase n=1 Tax=Virgibacillus sp. W0430 TaxID=3391580 RepID=UPI003F464F63
MKLIKAVDYTDMSNLACDLIVQKLKDLAEPVLGLATGSTPEGLYECLIKKNKQGEITFENTTSFNLDEYIGLADDNPNSYHYFMNEKLFDHVNIAKERAHVPSGVAKDFTEECEQYEKMITEAGGIDVQLLGLGVNGHIGFNEPGTSFSSRTHVVELDESTRNANAHFFASGWEVPSQAISMGIETIMESKEIILLASGEKKAEAIARLLNGEVSEAFPASVLHNHANVTIIADEAARSKLK